MAQSTPDVLTPLASLLCLSSDRGQCLSSLFLSCVKTLRISHLSCPATGRQFSSCHLYHLPSSPALNLESDPLKAKAGKYKVKPKNQRLELQKYQKTADLHDKRKEGEKEERICIVVCSKRDRTKKDE